MKHDSKVIEVTESRYRAANGSTVWLKADGQRITPRKPERETPAPLPTPAPAQPTPQLSREDAELLALAQLIGRDRMLGLLAADAPAPAPAAETQPTISEADARRTIAAIGLLAGRGGRKAWPAWNEPAPEPEE